MNESQVPEQVASYRQIRWTGMEILARREHSHRELQQKLTLRYPDSMTLIEQVIEDLKHELLQSDERYTEAYVVMRKRKGYGPQRLQQELKEKGVEQSLVLDELCKPEHDWFEQAKDVLRKKFKEPARDMKERAKQIRFLQYRGFAHDQIQEAMKFETSI